MDKQENQFWATPFGYSVKECRIKHVHPYVAISVSDRKNRYGSKIPEQMRDKFLGGDQVAQIRLELKRGIIKTVGVYTMGAYDTGNGPASDLMTDYHEKKYSAMQVLIGSLMGPKEGVQEASFRRVCVPGMWMKVMMPSGSSFTNRFYQSADELWKDDSELFSFLSYSYIINHVVRQFPTYFNDRETPLYNTLLDKWVNMNVCNIQDLVESLVSKQSSVVSVTVNDLLNGNVHLKFFNVVPLSSILEIVQAEMPGVRNVRMLCPAFNITAPKRVFACSKCGLAVGGKRVITIDYIEQFKDDDDKIKMFLDSKCHDDDKHTFTRICSSGAGWKPNFTSPVDVVLKDGGDES
jgi:hypothetical protein